MHNISPPTSRTTTAEEILKRAYLFESPPACLRLLWQKHNLRVIVLEICNLGFIGSVAGFICLRSIVVFQGSIDRVFLFMLLIGGAVFGILVVIQVLENLVKVSRIPSGCLF